DPADLAIRKSDLAPPARRWAAIDPDGPGGRLSDPDAVRGPAAAVELVGDNVGFVERSHNRLILPSPASAASRPPKSRPNEHINYSAGGKRNKSGETLPRFADR